LTKKTNQNKLKQKNILNSKNSNKKFYFASANTCSGFMHYFDEIFNPQHFEKIYLIKGCLGDEKSFKSHIINEIVNKASDNKYSVECFCNPLEQCSDCPKYLDGIIINDLKIAVVDGTNPYISDSKYPGIVENIINLGELFDEKKLTENKKEIFELKAKTMEFYDSAYKFLKAANELVEYAMTLSQKYINDEKANAAIDRILNKYLSEKHEKNEKNEKCDDNTAPVEEYRFINTVSPSGFNEFNTLEVEAKKVFYISNDNFSGFYYMKKLLSKLEKTENANQLFRIISPDTLNLSRTKAVYIKNGKILFVIKDKTENKVYSDKYNFINMERFVTPELKKDHKQKLKFLQKCYNSLIEAAADCFKEIKILNSSIEDIYLSSADSEGQNKYAEMIVKKLIT
jgi:hypothetical protein